MQSKHSVVVAGDQTGFQNSNLKWVEIRKSLRKTQENVDQSGESKAPLGWQVVRTKGVANQSWSKTFSKFYF